MRAESTARTAVLVLCVAMLPMPTARAEHAEGPRTWMPAGAGDLDQDHDVDTDDMSILSLCATGPALPYDISRLPAGCELSVDARGRIAADTDGDGDVDQEDFAALQRECGSRSPVLGVGLSPRTLDAEGFFEAFDGASRIASIGLVQVPFVWDLLESRTDCSSYTSNYDWLITPREPDGKDLFAHYGLKRAIWLDFLQPARRDTLTITNCSPPAAFTNPEVARAYVKECTWLADHFNPDFLALGTEIDGYLAVCGQDEQQALLEVIREAIHAIKLRHPSAVVFVYFQYEHVVSQNLWSVIKPFAETSDVFAFSTYPSYPVDGPDTGLTAAALPADYYSPIGRHLGIAKEVLFAEVGHPAAASALFSFGCPYEQAAFIRRWSAVLPRNTTTVVWTYLFDPWFLCGTYTPDVAAYFESIGLMRAESTP